MRLSAVRDRELSLWQSAVAETSGSIAKGDQGLAQAIQRGVSMQAVAGAKGQDLPDPGAPPASPQEASTTAFAKLSQLVFQIAMAQQRGEITHAEAAKRLTDVLVRGYSTLDLLGWLTCVTKYVEYYIAAHKEPPYRDWSKQTPPDMNFGVIDWKLPATCKILMVGDWGTRMPDNVAMLCTGLAAWQPDAVIHLGDVYYSGTQHECEQNVLAILDGLGRLNIKRPPFFTIPGNHEYYSGGGGFFNMIDRVNNGIAGCQQRASYFSLRTEDGRWQFLGMDTGYNDRDPVHSSAPDLQASETAWHKDKLDNFAGTTVLLSHHQLFSANSKLTEGATPWLNTPLHNTFSPYFPDRVPAWFWGHEHNYVIYKDNLFGLQKGRLLGCSAYEESKSENPYDNKYPDAVPYAVDMKQVDLSPYQGDVENYYNHAMALLEVSPETIDVSYYQYPSWGIGFVPAKPDAPTLMYKETIKRMR